MRDAANTNGDFYTSAEARFALWDVLVREKDIPAALVVAQRLTIDFPSNVELTRFIDSHGAVLRSK
jgi:hypothetical protein